VPSAVLLVALLVVVDLSYRRWMRRSIARRMQPARRAETVVVLDEAEAAPEVARGPRDERARDERRSG
jgi:hypothetical protein